MENAPGYSEATEHVRTSAVPLSHVSIEVGHFYMHDLTNGVDRIKAQFRRIVPLVAAFTESAKAEYGPNPRVSTCFLIDDYFRTDTKPAEILGRLLDAAAETGLRIDYLAREAGCWEVPAVVQAGVLKSPEIKLAELVRGRIVAEPEEGTNGRRPPTAESGWLCNGKRANDSRPGQAMHPDEPYEPPEEFGRREHSIFLDVEMWATVLKNRRTEVGTKWSCPYLASIWQLLRLGMLRYEGRPIAEPQPWVLGSRWPDNWWEMPTVLQLEPRAKPFAAYQSLSILPQRYVGIEHAVRVILDHVQLDDEVVDQIVGRGRDEGLTVPRKVTERLGHMLLAGS
ncbi:SCO2522 family protein [Nocardia takedensis]|uniref:SCO2522 family protein n=1 Tax=Nocardia takedensis TaxID=259390 RepID=UPI00030100AD|nr:SCO2522 family protein [Nocardia takedensis]